jgi:hypothetical protein
MNNQHTISDQNEQDILAIEVTDQALEAAAFAGSDNLKSFTVAMCTGGLECPFSK